VLSTVSASRHAAQKAILRERFDDGTWECPRILSELDHTHELYFDRVSQIKMDHWSRGRAVLVGDATLPLSIAWGYIGICSKSAPILRKKRRISFRERPHEENQVHIRGSSLVRRTAGARR